MARADVVRGTWIAGPLVVLAACGSAGPAPLEAIAACTGEWTTVAPTPAPAQALVYGGGTLYYETAPGSSTLESMILAQPITGDAPATVTSFPVSSFGEVFDAADIWLEGDSLIYTQGEQENQFFSVPIAGGPAQLLADMSTGSVSVDAGFVQHHALTTTDFIWTEGSLTGGTTMSVRSMARSGETPADLGTVSSRAGPPAITGVSIVGNEVVAAGQAGVAQAFALPPLGAMERALATRADVTQHSYFAGIGEPGVLWQIVKPGTSLGDDEWATALAPTDGSPVRTFWNVPAHTTIDRLWSDGAGGWIAIGSERFKDAGRSVLWSIDSQGKGRRLACSPSDDLSAVEQRRPAITAGAVYLVAQRAQTGGKFQFEIDRITR